MRYSGLLMRTIPHRAPDNVSFSEPLRVDNARAAAFGATGSNLRTLKNIELRGGLGATLRTTEAYSIVSGRAAPYGIPSADLGGFREVYQAGCFARSIANSDPRAVVEASTRRVLGRSSAGTLRLFDGPRGLDFEIDVPETSFGQDLIVSMRRGDIDGASTGFFIKAFRWEMRSGERTRVIEEAELLFVSVCAFPLHESAQAEEKQKGAAASNLTRMRAEEFFSAN